MVALTAARSAYSSQSYSWTGSNVESSGYSRCWWEGDDIGESFLSCLELSHSWGRSVRSKRRAG
jgi:hypothetical protein